MLKMLAVSAISAVAGAGATIQAVSSNAVLDDRCQSLGYTVCLVHEGVSRPTTGDPKVRREFNRFVRQISRDKL